MNLVLKDKLPEVEAKNTTSFVLLVVGIRFTFTSSSNSPRIPCIVSKIGKWPAISVGVELAQRNMLKSISTRPIAS